MTDQRAERLARSKRTAEALLRELLRTTHEPHCCVVVRDTTTRSEAVLIDREAFLAAARALGTHTAAETTDVADLVARIGARPTETPVLIAFEEGSVVLWFARPLRFTAPGGAS